LTLTIKCRLYPTHGQQEKLEETLDGCRWVYNYFRKKEMSVEDMQFVLTELKESHPWLYNYHSKMLQMVVHQIDAARKALKTLRQHGRKIGKLKYSEESDTNTFMYNQSGFKIERHGNTDLLWLSKVGYVEVRLHRQLLKIKQVSVTRKPSGKWFANVVCEQARPRVIPTTIDTSKCVGIDVGIRNFIYDSDGHSVPNPRFLKKMLKPLRRADRKLSRRKIGSNNYQKAKHMRARLYERMYNRRRDFHHKVSTEYANKYDVIFLERLQIPNMVLNHKLARAILDCGWGTFKDIVQYKAKLTFDVEPAYSTIECSRCHAMVPKSLAVRTHVCPECGLVLDRDHNSGIVIEQRGRVLLCLPPPLPLPPSVRLPQGLREVTPVETVRQSLKQEEAIVFFKRW
jgi:putative transposase